MTKYKVVSYVRVEDYDPTYFDSISDAESELDHLEIMNSCRENYYVIEEVDSDDLLPSNPVERDTLLRQLGAIAQEDYEDTDIADQELFNANDPINW
jgi:hypothetical protein